MTKQQAQQIMADVSCGCDGYGVVPGPDGVVVICDSCSGKFRSNAELKEARKVLAE